MKKGIMLLTALIVMITSMQSQNNPTKKCNVVTSFGSHIGEFEIAKTEFISVTNITVKNNCNDNSTYQILSYDYTTINIDKNTIFIKGKGDGAFSKEILVVMKGLSQGAKVFFDNIKSEISGWFSKRRAGTYNKAKVIRSSGIDFGEVYSQ